MFHMEVTTLLRGARTAAGLTQAELARRAGTVQSAIAAYESGERRPSLDTLGRLVRAADHELELVLQPKLRRGAASLAELATDVSTDLERGRENDALRLLFGFTDDFRATPRPGRVALIRDEPRPTGDPRFDAALAGIAELFAAQAGIPLPRWVDGPERHVEPLWLVSSLPGMHAYALARTPAALLRHGVLMAKDVFERV
jgi:transcriptional regulator with XRE-family HTH domain